MAASLYRWGFGDKVVVFVFSFDQDLFKLLTFVAPLLLEQAFNQLSLTHSRTILADWKLHLRTAGRYACRLWA